MLKATVERGRQLRRRRRRLYGLGGAAVCVALIVAVALWATDGPSREIHVASDAPRATASTTGAAPTTTAPPVPLSTTVTTPAAPLSTAAPPSTSTTKAPVK